MRSLVQIGGMVVYEFLIHWRRRAVVVVLLSMIAVPVLAALRIWREMAIAQEVTGAADPRQITVTIVYFTWSSAFIALMLLLPAVVAESIPRDREYQMRELLDSLPLAPGRYLAGKVLGLWALVFGIVLFDAAVVAVCWRWIVGPFDLTQYMEMWLVGAGGLALLHGTSSLLLAASQPSRRRAILVGAAVTAILIYVLTPGLQAAPGSAASILNPSRPALFTYYMWGWLGMPVPVVFGSSASWADMSKTLLAGAAEMAVLWVAVWAWLDWRARRGN